MRLASHRAAARALALSLLAAALAPSGPARAAASSAPVIGEIERITLDDPSDHWSGGTIVVGGQVVTVPRNLLLDLPANRVTLQQLFAEAPAACVAVGETGLVRGDGCNPGGAGGVATIAANRTAGGNVIAGDVFIVKGQDTATGVVTWLDVADGYFRLNGTPGDPATGVMVRLNDPTARHTVQRGLGCAGGPNCSADPRFALDADNYVSVFTSGYPLCIPSTQARTFADVLGLGTTTAQAQPDGTGDVLCPQTNRPATGPVADSRRFAPVRLGDSVTASGNFERVNGVKFLSSHTTKVLAALTTGTAANQPDYMFLSEAFLDAPGFQNQRARSLFIGFQTVAPANVLLWSVHYDPATSTRHELPLGSTAGCDAAAGAGSCTGQGLVATGADIFRIRHDIDFAIGVKKPELNPCAHLRADPRFASLNICPNGGASGSNIAEMFAVLSPLPHEIQARTGKKYASLQAGGTPLLTLDVSGNPATNGQYLFPFGIGLGGIDMPNAFEFDLNAVSTPYSFSGIPWLLDRRLSPGGCQGGCEATPQPLSPFPFEGLDPRTLAAVPAGSVQAGAFTATTLGRAADRIISFIDPALGTFNGNVTRLAWPPVDPAPWVVSPTPDVPLICAAAPPPNRPPVATADAAITTAGTPVTVAVLANDLDPDGNPLTVTAVTDGAGGTVVNNGSSVTYTPAPGFTGGDAFSYTISDGAGGTASAPVSVTVNPPANRPPLAGADTVLAVSGQPTLVPVLANDTDPDGDPLSIVAVTQGAGGTVVNNGVSVTYTPTPLFSGPDAFTYLIADGRGGVAVGDVSVTVISSETLVVQTALFRIVGAEWRVSGTSTVPGATVTIHLGPTLGGAEVGTAVVGANGAWSFRQLGSAVPADATRQISVESTGGASRLAVGVLVR